MYNQDAGFVMWVAPGGPGGDLVCVNLEATGLYRDPPSTPPTSIEVDDGRHLVYRPDPGEGPAAYIGRHRSGAVSTLAWGATLGFTFVAIKITDKRGVEQLAEAYAKFNDWAGAMVSALKAEEAFWTEDDGRHIRRNKGRR